MKVICDVHIPYRLVDFFIRKGIHAIHVNAILEKWNTKDADLSRYADAEEMMLITKDSDFRDSFFLHKTPKRLIRVTLGNISNNELIKTFETHLDLLRENYKKDFCYVEIGADSVSVIVFE